MERRDRTDRADDPLGTLLELAGGHRLLGAWRAPGLRGMVRTGATNPPGSDQRAWIEVALRLDAAECQALIRENLLDEEEVRYTVRAGDRPIARLRAFPNPATTSPADLIGIANDLSRRSAHLRHVAKAQHIAAQIAELLGQDLTRYLVPAWDQITAMGDEAGQAWLSTDRSCLTDAPPKDLGEAMRNGLAPGLRLGKENGLVRVAAATRAASFHLEASGEEIADLTDLACSALGSPSPSFAVYRVAELRSSQYGQLFHLEHTATAGTHLWVFEPWTARLAMHSTLSALWQAAVAEKTTEARGQLKRAIWQYQNRIGHVDPEPVFI